MTAEQLQQLVDQVTCPDCGHPATWTKVAEDQFGHAWVIPTYQCGTATCPFYEGGSGTWTVVSIG